MTGTHQLLLGWNSYFKEVTDMKNVFTKELLIIIAIIQNCTELNIGK